MKLLFLLIVALLNLAVGFALALFLGHRPRLAGLKLDWPFGGQPEPRQAESSAGASRPRESQPPAAEPADTPARILGEAVQRLQEAAAELDQHQQRLQDLATPLPPGELDQAASATDDISQRLLQHLSMLIERLRKLGRDEQAQQLISDVERAWDRLHAMAVKLVTLSIGDDQDPQALEGLRSICSDMHTACGEIHDAFHEQLAGVGA